MGKSKTSNRIRKAKKPYTPDPTLDKSPEDRPRQGSPSLNSIGSRSPEHQTPQTQYQHSRSRSCSHSPGVRRSTSPMRHGSYSPSLVNRSTSIRHRSPSRSRRISRSSSPKRTWHRGKHKKHKHHSSTSSNKDRKHSSRSKHTKYQLDASSEDEFDPMSEQFSDLTGSVSTISSSIGSQVPNGIQKKIAP